MARVTLTIQDGKWGELSVEAVYDPPVKDGDEMTTAQLLGATLHTQVIPDLIGDEGDLKNSERAES